MASLQHPGQRVSESARPRNNVPAGYSLLTRRLGHDGADQMVDMNRLDLCPEIAL